MSQATDRVPAAAEAGMSLIEMIVVMTIIGLMAAIGLPSMQQWLDRYQVRTAATEIAAAIQLQRMRAVSQNRDFSIAFNSDAGTYALYDGDPDGGTMIEPQARSLPMAILFTGGGDDPVQIPDDEIIFHADGSLNDGASSADQVYLGNTNGDVFSVSINRATGRVEVEHQSYGY